MFFLVLFLLFSSCGKKDELQALPTTMLKVGDQSVKVELALWPKEQARGLMHRRALAEMSGMLFSFPRDRKLRFYMKNTLIPLSIAYLDKNGVIREIYHMQPLDSQIVASRWPRRFALEMNRGWFKRHKVGPGQRVTTLEGQPLQHRKLQELAGGNTLK